MDASAERDVARLRRHVTLVGTGASGEDVHLAIVRRVTGTRVSVDANFGAQSAASGALDVDALLPLDAAASREPTAHADPTDDRDGLVKRAGYAVSGSVLAVPFFMALQPDLGIIYFALVLALLSLASP